MGAQGLQQAASKLQQLFDESGMEAGIWNRRAPLRTGSATDLDMANGSPGNASARPSEVRSLRRLLGSGRRHEAA